MKNRALSIVLIGCVLGLLTASAGAQDKTDDGLVIKGNVAAGVPAVKEAERSSKVTEHRDVPRASSRGTPASGPRPKPSSPRERAPISPPRAPSSRAS